MRILVIGAGNTGRHLVEKLCEMNHDVVVVDHLLQCLHTRHGTLDADFEQVVGKQTTTTTASPTSCRVTRVPSQSCGKKRSISAQRSAQVIVQSSQNPGWHDARTSASLP